MEVTLKIISHLVKQHVCVLIQNFLWLSADIDIDHAGIFYMYQDGVFHGCTRLTYEPLQINYTEMLQQYTSIEVPQPQSNIVNRSQLHASSEVDGEQSTDKLSQSVVSAEKDIVIPMPDVHHDMHSNTSAEKEGEPKTDDPGQSIPPGDTANEVHQSTPVVQSGKLHAEPFAQYSRNEVLSPIRKQNDLVMAQQSVFPTRTEEYNQQMIVSSDTANQPGPITRIIQAQEPIAVESFCYGCKKCGQTFQSEQGYYNHMFESHRIRNPNLHRPIITKRFDKVNTSTEKINPRDVDNSMECGYCSKEYLSYTSLKYHIGVDHESMPAYFCPSCDKVFYVDSQLDAHYATVHGNEFNEQVTRKEKEHKALERIRSRMNRSSTGEEPQFACAFCDTVMYTRGGMEVHQLNCSSNPENEKFSLFKKKENLTVTAESVKAWRNASAEQRTDDESKASTSQKSPGGKKKPRTIRHSGLYKSDRRKPKSAEKEADEITTTSKNIQETEEGDTAQSKTSSHHDSTISSTASVDTPDVIVKSPSALPKQDESSKNKKGSVELQMAQYWSKQAMDPRYKNKRSLYLRRSKKFFEIYYAETKKRKLQEQTTDESTLSVNISEDEQKAADEKMKQSKKRKKVTFSEESDDIPSIDYTVPTRRSQRKRGTSSSDTDKNGSKDVTKEDIDHTLPKRRRHTSSQSSGKEENKTADKGNKKDQCTRNQGTEDKTEQTTDKKSPKKSNKGSIATNNQTKGKHDRSFLTKDPRCKHDENLLRKKKYRLRSEQKVVKHSDGDNSKDQDWVPESDMIDVRVTRQTDRKKKEQEQEQSTDISIVRTTRSADKKKTTITASEPTANDGKSRKEQTDDVQDKKQVEQQGKKRKRTEDESSDDITYPCEKCGEIFNDNNEYKKHKAICFKRPRKFICPYKKCRKPFNQKIMMNQHYKYHHTNEPKEFVCKKCDTDFVYKKSLRIHILRLHTEDKDKAFICEICGKVFAQKWEYSAHRKDTHATVKAYNCGICKKSSFTTAARLESHVKNCGKVPDIECGQCGKKFLTEANLITHVNDTHRKNLIWQCFVCSKTYQTEGGFYNHLRTKHGISRAKNNTLKMQNRSEPPIKIEFTVDPEEDEGDAEDEENNGEESDSNKKQEKKPEENSPTRKSPRKRKPSATVSKPPDSSQ